MPSKFTKHARTRMQQRGITEEVAQIILIHADKEISVGHGLVSMSVSNRQLKKLGKDGRIDPQLIDKVSGRSLVVANDNDSAASGQMVVTALHINNKAGRHHRKPCPRKYNRSR